MWPSVWLEPHADAASERRGGAMRQRQDEPRALAHRALAADAAIVFAHDAVGNGQAEASTATDRLGREERVVNPSEVLGRNSRTSIGYFGDDGIAFEACGDGQPAAARHRVTGVQEQR